MWKKTYGSHEIPNGCCTVPYGHVWNIWVIWHSLIFRPNLPVCFESLGYFFLRELMVILFWHLIQNMDKLTKRNSLLPKCDFWLKWILLDKVIYFISKFWLKWFLLQEELTRILSLLSSILGVWYHRHICSKPRNPFHIRDSGLMHISRCCLEQCPYTFARHC